MAIKMLLENSYEEQTVKDLSNLATIVLLLLCDVSYLGIGFLELTLISLKDLCTAPV